MKGSKRIRNKKRKKKGLKLLLKYRQFRKGKSKYKSFGWFDFKAFQLEQDWMNSYGGRTKEFKDKYRIRVDPYLKGGKGSIRVYSETELDKIIEKSNIKEVLDNKFKNIVVFGVESLPNQNAEDNEKYKVKITLKQNEKTTN